MFISIIEKNVNISRKEDFINKYKLTYIEKYKSYDIQNIRIICDKDSIDFYKVIDGNNKYEIKNIAPFSFYDVDEEREYELYQNEEYILKSYITYFDLELINK